ncbi:hypothetical protein SAMN05444392_101258 [Seinonella peptonophila]|uniref:Uncharacterized protein n=1 Tax=Seinonella peptonophila TaxID=112248 RepID=A0A1M4T1L7_9BACL|nr:hypothetical protein [Seinonella peptonophila]SHE38270.1 hypothetical protein SAMN05444392_101258 [Seinonella peptonophila]
MSEQRDRALFTIASMGANLPVPAIDLLATNSWLTEMIKHSALDTDELLNFLQQITNLQGILLSNAHRLSSVPANQQPSHQQIEIFLSHLREFQDYYQSQFPGFFNSSFGKAFNLKR